MPLRDIVRNTVTILALVVLVAVVIELIAWLVDGDQLDNLTAALMLLVASGGIAGIGVTARDG